MSASRSPTLAPLFASDAARFAATVDFPTPPFPLPTAMMFFTPLMRPVSGAGGRLTSAVMFTRTSLTPGTLESTAWRDCSRRRSLTGQAGVVRFTSKDTTPSAIFMLRMKLRETMSLPRSGSITERRASKIADSVMAAFVIQDSVG